MSDGKKWLRNDICGLEESRVGGKQERYSKDYVDVNGLI